MTATEIYVALFTAAIGSSGFMGLIMFFVTRHYRIKDEKLKADSVERKTLGALSYVTISNEIDKLIAQGYATSEQRRALEVLFDAYKANGWNGDMDARMDVVHHLPFREEEK